jgi:hypothetical protein
MVQEINDKKNLLIFIISFVLIGCTDSEMSSEKELSIIDFKSDVICKNAEVLENDFYLKNYTCLLQLLFDEPCLKLNQEKYKKYLRLSFLDEDYSVDIFSIRQNESCYIESLKNIPPNMYSIPGYFRSEGIVQYTKKSMVSDEDQFYGISNLSQYFSEQEWNLEPPPPVRLWMLEILSGDELYVGYADSDNLSSKIQSELGLLLGFSTIYSIDPNPFHDKTTISYNLPSDGNIRIEIMDTSNKTIEDIIQLKGNMGFNKVEIDLTSLAIGLYNVKIFFQNNILYDSIIRKK